MDYKDADKLVSEFREALEARCSKLGYTEDRISMYMVGYLTSFITGQLEYNPNLAKEIQYRIRDIITHQY